MEGGALLQDDFAEFAKDYVLFCHITSKVEGDAYQSLLGEKGGRGFPFLVFLNADGDVVARHAGQRNAEGFAATGKGAQDFIALKKRVEEGDESARADYFMARLAMGSMAPDVARAELEGLGDALSEEQRTSAEDQIFGAEVSAGLQSARRDPEALAKLGASWIEHLRAGRTPAGRAAMGFYMAIIEHAKAEKDVKVFEEALDGLRKSVSDNPRAQGFVKRIEDQLAKLKEELAPDGGEDAPDGGKKPF